MIQGLEAAVIHQFLNQLAAYAQRNGKCLKLSVGDSWYAFGSGFVSQQEVGEAVMAIQVNEEKGKGVK